MQPTPEYLREALDYDASTGLLTWKTRPEAHFPYAQAWKRWNTMFAGKPAFVSGNRAGYPNGMINDRHFTAHRIIFAMWHGRWPALIDHADGNKTNNRISNLREATTSQNCWNVRPNNGRTGLKGVAPSNPKYANTKYHARIQLAGKYTYLGTYNTPEEAHAAYKAAAEKHFGEFARAA